MKLLDGRKVAAEILDEIRSGLTDLNEGKPGLCFILVGDHAPSQAYVGHKEKACAAVGIHSERLSLPADVSMDELRNAIDMRNADPSIHGIIVQLPVPDHLDPLEVSLAIAPEKDVDGLHPMNVGMSALGCEGGYLPCTPMAIIEILQRNGISVAGKNVCIVGRSHIVGQPLANQLMQKSEHGNATVTVVHTRSTNMKEHCLKADIVVAAAGRPNTVDASMVRPGAVVIDVGINRVEDPNSPKGYRLCGDVDFESVKDLSSWITPVPGGVGPVTVAILLRNTYEGFRRSHEATSLSRP